MGTGLFCVQSPDCVSVGLVPQFLLKPRQWDSLDQDLMGEVVIRLRKNFSMVRLVKVAQGSCGTSIPRDVQDSAGHGTEGPDLGASGRAWTRHHQRGPFQPKLLCNCMS